MKISYDKAKVVAPIGLVFFLISSGAFGWGERLYVGNSVFNACKSIPVLSAPNPDSRVVRQLSFGESVKVQSHEGVYELPDSDAQSLARQKKRSSGSRNEDDAKAINPNTYKRPAWIGIGNNEFVIAACLVDADLMKKQNPEQAKARLASLKGVKVKKGFTEEEEGDVVVMKGAAGKAKKGVAQTGSIDDYLAGLSAVDTRGQLGSFRKEGKLGEYSN